ncbi:hypothetical protein QV13_01190 [Mesorhizobium hungaricum]|jgi:hypothetical protein|uniref:Uncharacterized protein n=1 Tax=Mesorhizobium hungaricum TaxID=1566387 RepID=A0A1C2EDC5_9HYPH|nr:MULTISPECIES: hypothetical protein [Mesorhizobium]MDQ0333419.1 hypothetical protein [Mesorhizobium sp. YL-MeA3-2017]OCX24957.1 hypothetical protein QV13_01190 [Mesorhizobium hungaricum]
MPDDPNYETGAREPVEKKQPDANEDVSQGTATNKLPPTPFGNSEPVDDVDEKPRHSDGQSLPFEGSPSPSTEQIAGAGPAISERSKDAHASAPNRQPGAYVEDDPLPNLPDGGASAAEGKPR